MIAISCPSCGKSLNVPIHYAGKTGKCPRCRTPIEVPHRDTPIASGDVTIPSPASTTEQPRLPRDAASSAIPSNETTGNSPASSRVLNATLGCQKSSRTEYGGTGTFVRTEYWTFPITVEQSLTGVLPQNVKCNACGHEVGVEVHGIDEMRLKYYILPILLIAILTALSIGFLLFGAFSSEENHDFWYLPAGFCAFVALGALLSSFQDPYQRKAIEFIRDKQSRHEIFK